jgi:hypothetical protein
MPPLAYDWSNLPNHACVAIFLKSNLDIHQPAAGGVSFCYSAPLLLSLKGCCDETLNLSAYSVVVMAGGASRSDLVNCPVLSAAALNEQHSSTEQD